MIATGTTLIKAAHVLQKRGIEHIYAAATHGVFSGDALKNLESSPLEKIFVTNTIAQKHVSPKISVIDIANLLESLIKE
jgi:ribose-phosphate pyrophosphokinase